MHPTRGSRHELGLSLDDYVNILPRCIISLGVQAVVLSFIYIPLNLCQFGNRF